MNINKQLPKDWKWVKLGEILTVSSGKGLKVNSLVGGNFPVYGGNGLNGYHSEYLIEDSKLIIGRVGVRCGVIHITKPKSWVTDNALVVQPKKKEVYDLKYLSLKLTFENLNKLSVSTAQPVISGNKIYAYEISLPPLPIQTLIVAKIETLFTQLDAAIQTLLTAQAQLKTYRQAVLKYAFEGKLTDGLNYDLNDLDDIHDLKTNQKNLVNKKNHSADNEDLPDGWKWVKLGDVCEVKRGKSKHRPRNAPELYGGIYPFIQTGDVRNANGGYINSHFQTYSEIGLAQSKLWEKGTLCITIAANIGETAILKYDACFPDSIVGLLPNKVILNNIFLNYFLISFKQKLEELAPATAQKNINAEILENITIPLPQLATQHLIILAIESRLSVADKLQESISQSLAQAAALRQSILKKAFEGELI